VSSPQNLVLRSEEFDNAIWTKTLETITANATTAPDGTVTADLVTDSVDGSDQVHACLQAMALATPGGGTYTFSIYLKDASGGAHPWCYVSLTSGASGIVVSTLDGSVGTASADLVDYEVEDVGNGWWRMSVTTKTPTSFTGFSCGVYTAPSGVAIAYTGTGTARFYMWGAQATRGGGPQPYVKTTTLYYDDGRPCRTKALGSQNLATWSEAFQNAAWIKNTGVTCFDATTDVTDPLGGHTGSKVVYDGTGTVNTFNLANNVGTSRYKNELGNIGIWIRCLSGSFTLRLSENWSGALQTITVTSSWGFYSFSNPALADVITLQFAIYKGASDNAARTFYVWHPQVSRTAGYLGPYKKTQGQQIGGGPGRQLRAQGQLPQNLISDPSAFDSSNWTASDLFVNNDVVDSPVTPGDSSGDQLLEANTTAFHTISQVLSSPGEGHLVTFSVWFAPDGSRQYAGLVCSDNVSVVYETTFDIINGAVSHTSANLIESGIGQANAFGWRRAWMMFRIANSKPSLVAEVFLSDTSGAFHTYAGSSSNGCYAWGAQLTTGALQPFVDTTVPTTALPAQRSRAVHAQNLIPYSEQFDQASSWGTSGGSISANAVANPITGAIDADALIDSAANSAHQILQAGGVATSFPEGTPYCMSVYVKLAKPGTAPVLLLSGSAALGGGGAYFNLVTQGRNNVFFPDSNSACEDVGNGWFRLSIFGRSISSNLTQFALSAYADASGTTYLGNGTAAFYVWGAQISATKLPIPYVKTGALALASPTVPASSPIAASRGQLVFPQNIIIGSEQFDLWTPSNVTVAANTSSGPFGGGTTADKITDSSDSGVNTFHLVGLSPSPPVTTIGKIITFSCYFLPILGVNNVILMLVNSQTAFAYFDLVNGQVIAVGGTTALLAQSCEQAGGGWVRCSITYVGSTNDLSIATAVSAGSGYLYAGTGTARFYMFGAQLNVGPTALPYVKTTTTYPGVHPDVPTSRGAV
jgi:hypothetical protein